VELLRSIYARSSISKYSIFGVVECGFSKLEASGVIGVDWYAH
jgi:hypothetical protein